jgi:hypothetical protein
MISGIYHKMRASSAGKSTSAAALATAENRALVEAGTGVVPNRVRPAATNLFANGVDKLFGCIHIISIKK